MKNIFLASGLIAASLIVTGCGAVKFSPFTSTGNNNVNNVTDTSPTPTPPQDASPTPTPGSSASPTATPTATPKPTPTPTPTPPTDMGICKLVRPQSADHYGDGDNDHYADNDDGYDKDDGDDRDDYDRDHYDKDDAYADNDDRETCGEHRGKTRVGFRDVSDCEFSRAAGLPCPNAVDGDDYKDGDHYDRDDHHDGDDGKDYDDSDKAGRYLAPVHGHKHSVCMTKTACEVYINSYLNTTGGILLAKPASPAPKMAAFATFKRVGYCNEGDKDKDRDRDRDHDRDHAARAKFSKFSDDRVQSEISRLIEYWKNRK